MVSSGEAADKVAVDKLQHRLRCDSGSHEMQQIPVHAPEHPQKGSTSSLMPKKAPVEPDAGVLHSEGSISSVILSEKASKTPDRAIHPLQYGLEGSSPVIREKVSEDGYNWRKYGQKLVKGNEFIRSYYKCTHPKCLAKKQLECSQDGQIIDTFCFGQHDHPKPHCTPLAVGFVVSIVEKRQDEASLSVAQESSSEAHCQTPHQNEPTNALQLSAVASSDDMKDARVQSNRMKDETDKDDHPDSKRRKKDSCNVEANPVNKPTGGPRVVVQTLSEVDIVNDGYRWRKYGQKLVKGNPHPRSYYRCSSHGCPVKKHVERASHDPKLLLTTYEGQHDHDMPPARTVTHNTAGSDIHKTTNNRESGSTVEGSSTVCLDMVAYSKSGPESKSSDQLNGKSRAKAEVSGTVDRDPIDHSGLNLDCKSNEQQNVRSDTTEENDAVGHGELGTKSEENGNVCYDPVVYVTPHPESNFDEQQKTANAEPVLQSIMFIHGCKRQC